MGTQDEAGPALKGISQILAKDRGRIARFAQEKRIELSHGEKLVNWGVRTNSASRPSSRNSVDSPPGTRRNEVEPSKGVCDVRTASRVSG